MRRVCVFSGSSTGTRPEYARAAGDLGRELVARGLGLVYGGGGVGLMAVVADAALEVGGEVTGVIPEHLVDREIAHTGVSDLHVVDSMHERKARMSDLAGGFVALPGGYGTLEEFAEVLTWSQLGLQSKACGLLDTAGFYQPLLRFVDHAVAEGFVGPEQRKLILSAPSAGELLAAMQAWRPPDPQQPVFQS